MNLDVEHVGGFGLKTTKKGSKVGAKFASNLMGPEFDQIHGKVKGDNRDFKNQLGC